VTAGSGTAEAVTVVVVVVAVVVPVVGLTEGAGEEPTPPSAAPISRPPTPVAAAMTPDLRCQGLLGPASMPSSSRRAVPSGADLLGPAGGRVSELGHLDLSA
jgi:hypothetical protein